jgi:hypothetical protein
MTKEEPTHVDFDYGITTHLENYRHVKVVDWDEIGVRVVVKGEASGYDQDAIIGTLARNFSLEFAEEMKRGGQIVLEFDY